MSKEQEKKARSQPTKGLQSVQEQCQVGCRPQQAVLPGSRSQDLSLRGIHLPPLPRLESAQASGRRRAQADRLELRQALPRSSGSGDGRQPLAALPPLPWQPMPLTAAPQNAATAQGQVPTWSTLPAAASRSSPRGRAAAVGATASELAVPHLQGNRQHQDTTARAEGWQADVQVPAPPLKPAMQTPKSLRLAYRRRPVATRPGPCRKPARPGQRAATSTVGRPARATQVLAPKAGSSPAHQARPAPIAQEDTRDAVKASASRSLAAEQAADDGANAAGTSQATQGAKGSEERARSVKRGGMFLPCCLCSSTCSGALMDEQEEGGDAVERDAVAVTATDPGSTSFGEAEAQPPSSPVPGNLEHEVDRLELRNALTHSSIPGEGRQPLPTCGPSLHVPASPLKHAHATHKFFNLAYYRRRQVATRPGPCQKPAGPRQRAATSTVGRPARATQVLAPKAGSSPAHQARPAPSAQEGTQDAVKASASHSLAAEQAADDGANAAGTPQAVQSAKNTEDRAWSGKRGGMFLPCCLCTSTCNGLLMDEQEEEEDSPVAEAAKSPVSTPSGEAQSWPPASAVPAAPRREGHLAPTPALLPEEVPSWDTDSFVLRDQWEDTPEQRKTQE
ncbi:NAC-alpha domain-containing protein 1-like isoform X1 [Gallus gallus]|uniref:NAC-alpha domain-containing protein 1-like isoform X1 n=1 Tax=Gallus gallus TaxID=9031 RepID=UPI001AE1C850|nr:NAC-alpha domain-containing protein 1-like isoform X1 [Gallus gallus]XP_046792099.1 NAC-alpha domain-containing protein 1-like isoform X1 [Gallus gallus]